MSYNPYTVKIRPCKFKPGDIVRLNCSNDVNHHKRGRVQAIKFDEYIWENVPVVQMINDFVAEDLFSESKYVKHTQLSIGCQKIGGNCVRRLLLE